MIGAAAAIMLDRSRGFLFSYSTMKLWEIRMNERGAGILLQNCHSLLSIRQIWIGRSILQDGRHTIITNPVS